MATTPPKSKDAKATAFPTQTTFAQRQAHRHAEATKDIRICEDLYSRRWTVLDVLREYKITGNILLTLRMHVVAMVAMELARTEYDDSNEAHAVIKSLKANPDIQATCDKFKIGKNAMIFKFVQVAYEALDKVMKEGVKEEKICNVMVKYQNGKGPDLARCVQLVQMDEADTEAFLDKIGIGRIDKHEAIHRQ